MTKIGFAMLIFLGTMNVLAILLDVVFENIKETLATNVINELLYALVYLASFLIPAFVLNFMMGKEKQTVMLEKKVPKDIAAYIFATISVVLIVSYVNFVIVNSFGYSEFSSKVLWGNEPLANHEIVLMFITTAIIPAFAEEFFFRGAILSALRPYGKTPSIFISAILFAFMHQNIEQLLYTFAAGLVLAWVVYETGSIWTSIIIHFFNNFLSVISTPILDRLPESEASVILFLIEFGIFVLGIASVIYLVIKKIVNKRKKAVLKLDSIYGVSVENLEHIDQPVENHIKPSKIFKYFFSPTIITFLILTILIMIYYIILIFIYNAGIL